ncbi:MAG: hypothetical protein JXB49_01535 [Bacteroidales bacterium]|nr:hypothetical protein [Bacteroidales bacterium]
MKLLNLMAIFGTILVMSSCGGDKKSGNNSDSPKPVEGYELNLAENNIPLVMTAPKGATVGKGAGVTEMNGVQYVNLSIKAQDYKLNVSMPDADITESLESIVGTQKDLALKNEAAEIVKDEANGFIYKFTNTKGENYGCIYVVIKDNRQITFTSVPPMSKNYTLDQAKAMYNSAKSAN